MLRANAALEQLRKRAESYKARSWSVFHGIFWAVWNQPSGSFGVSLGVILFSWSGGGFHLFH